MSKINQTFRYQLHKALDDMGEPKRGRGVFLAGQLGVSHTAASKWLKGDFAPSGKRLEEIAKTVKKSTKWLLFGEDYSIKSKLLQLRELPILTYNQAGEFKNMETLTNINETRSLPKDNIPNDQCFGLIVKGDSMYHPTDRRSLNDGDTVVVDPLESFEIGDIVIAKINAGAAIKVYGGDESFPILHPLNPKYESIIEMTYKANQCTIIGVVISVIPPVRKLK